MNACKILLRKINRHELCVRLLSTNFCALNKCDSYQRAVLSVYPVTNSRIFVRCSLFLNNSRSIHVTQDCTSGSNKWSKIKQVKVGKDLERSKVINSYINRIRNAIKESSITDPKNNSTVKKLIEEARGKNIPMSSIETVIASTLKARDASSLHYLEGRGLGGMYYIIEVSTDKLTKTKLDIQQIAKKHKSTIGEQGTALHAFERKGILDVTLPSPTMNMDECVEIAIEAGAEDVTLEEEDDEDGGEKYLRFVCEPDDLYLVKKELESKSLDLRSFTLDYLPNSLVSLGATEMTYLDKMMDKLHDRNDVLRVFLNVDTSDL